MLKVTVKDELGNVVANHSFMLLNSVMNALMYDTEDLKPGYEVTIEVTE